MSAHAGKGSAMHMEMVRVRFAAKHTPGPRAGSSCLADKVSDIRKLLRSDMSVGDIAKDLGVSLPTLRTFIKRRRLCNLTDRRNFITLKRSIDREEAREESR